MRFLSKDSRSCEVNSIQMRILLYLFDVRIEQNVIHAFAYGNMDNYMDKCTRIRIIPRKLLEWNIHLDGSNYMWIPNYTLC